jgi:tyrosyl-tRNA synthetase
MAFADVIRLNSRVTLRQLLQREDFKSRIAAEQPIGAHEIQYPIMQGWDSVQVKADVELGGTDQLFNILVGRDLQKEEGQPQQVVFLMPILEGLDGMQKMSKSLGNYVGINEPPNEIFGKLMSISDDLMARYYPLLLGRQLPNELHPMEAKKQLAQEIVATYHSAADAPRAQEDWERRFSEKRLDQSALPEFSPASDERNIVSLVAAAYREAFSLTKSRTEIRRLIEQGSVQLNGEKIRDLQAAVQLDSGQVLRLDKTRAVRVK